MPNFGFMRSVFLFLFCINAGLVCAQSQKKPAASKYPQNYFSSPLHIPLFLAGNFGECRPGHFHSGLDIKTNGEENQPVFAAADGYIYRIKMEKGGFGHALYIMHPNGYTTLYAHLNNFSPAIQKFLRSEQYKQEKWDIDVSLTPQQFPIKKGQQIAWSGNTGGSTAPHLHFEIRDSKTEHPLNPELFGLPIIDHTPPVIHELALYSRFESIFECPPRIIPLTKKGAIYKTTEDTIYTPYNHCGLAFNADDYMDGSTNTLSFYTAKLFMNNKLISQIKLDDIGYEETRYINAYTDYRLKKAEGKWMQFFFLLKGNELQHIYSFGNDNMGNLNLPEDSAVHIKIILTDDRNNSSTVSFYVKSDASYAYHLDSKQREGYKEFQPNDGPKEFEHENCYFFQAAKENKIVQPNISFTMDKHALYDDLCLQLDSVADADILSMCYSIHTDIISPYKFPAYQIPIHSYFDMKLRVNKMIQTAVKDRVVLMGFDGKDSSGTAAHYLQGGWYAARVRSIGAFWLAADTTSPQITSNYTNGADLSHAAQIKFKASDNMTSVKHFAGTIDGAWVCFEQHEDNFFYNFDEHCSKGDHILVFTATDESGNQKKVKFTFKR
jgi:hypothetical protein